MVLTELFSIREEVNKLLDTFASRRSVAEEPSSSGGDESPSDCEDEYEALYESYAAGVLNVDRSGGQLKSLITYPYTKYKVKALPSGSDSRILLPFVLGRALVRVSIYSLGSLPFIAENGDPSDLSSYHTYNSIYPPGFISKRKFYSLKEPTKRVYYISTIEPGPVFKIYAQAEPSQSWQSTISTQNVLEKLLSAFEGTIVATDTDWPIFSSGDDFFGLEHTVIRRQLEEMPGASLCKNYYRFATDSLQIV